MVFPELLAYGDLGLWLLRLVVGIVFLVHALPKLQKPAAMAQGMGWPSWSVMLLGLVELVGALSVILGVYTQVGAMLLSLVMLGALYFKISKWKTPFTAMDKTGWELDLLLLAAALAVLLTGGGS
ncbi:MAG: DoxX protein [Candidatus Uhrbacteria bacterium GW2011_GWA2_53_10]|uniref:DoxX protein n=1 Tax=Candidatus Uhrbacteria bacterium GW2011_GWA2_53_10 TaxID=1618980 RepID=A0A0G1XL14_9BACT|nr:MAG: DoxX protein [Candidatus Uhrbacteria bacterium GW2011_GWA2_53_10]